MLANPLLRSTGGVLLGMLIAQAIPLLGSLLIARLYAPSEFGTFSAWLGIVMTAAVLVTGRLEMALVVEADGEPRLIAMAATLATTVGAAAVLSVVVIGIYFAVPSVRDFTLVLVLAFLAATVLMATVQTWQSWAAAEGQYRALSVIRISQAAGITAIQILAGIIDPSPLGLAMGHVFGLLVGVLIASRLMPIPLRRFLPWQEFRVKLLDFWHRHKQFPLFALPADFINTAAAQLPLLLISSRFGSESSGFYALAVRILGGPISLLGTAILDVFKRTAAASYRANGSCRSEYLNTFRVLAVLGGMLAVGVILLAEPFFAWAFGEVWRQAGVISVWLMPMFALRFVASPLSYVFYITGGQKIDLAWQCGLLAITVLTLVLAKDFETSIKAYATGYAGMYVIYLVLSYRSSKGKGA